MQELSTIFSKSFHSSVKDEALSSWSVLCFFGQTYSLLFFSYLLERWKTQGQAITSLNIDDLDFAAVVAEFQMSFLGAAHIYWCGNISDLDLQKRKKFFDFVKNYSGPHQIIFFMSEPFDLSENAHAVSINLDDSINLDRYKELYSFFYKTASSLNRFAQTLFTQHKTVLLDDACLLMRYNIVAGERDRDFCAQWLDKILVPEKSLFTLSQHLYAREAKKFLVLWSQIEKDYPPEFWIAFWAEQLWQAALFVDYVRDHGPVAARKRVNRLPFSFMQRDYKRYKQRELSVAHNFLYSIDRGLKNGYATYGLDLFYAHFLQGNFSRK